MSAFVAVNKVFAGLASWDGLFKDVGIGGFVGCFWVRGFYAEQGAEFGDEGLGVGAFGCAGGGPAGEEGLYSGFDFHVGGLFWLVNLGILFFVERVGFGV